MNSIRQKLILASLLVVPLCIKPADDQIARMARFHAWVAREAETTDDGSWEKAIKDIPDIKNKKELDLSGKVNRFSASLNT